MKTEITLHFVRYVRLSLTKEESSSEFQFVLLDLIVVLVVLLSYFFGYPELLQCQTWTVFEKKHNSVQY